MSPAPCLSVGEAAARLGVAAHVLRHWEDVGVLVPERSPSGHRRYDEETVARARLIQVCQRAGMSLAQVSELRSGDRADRVELIGAHRADIMERVSRLQRADQFLAHVLECEHPIVLKCPECAQFAAAEPRLQHAKRVSTLTPPDACPTT